MRNEINPLKTTSSNASTLKQALTTVFSDQFYDQFSDRFYDQFSDLSGPKRPILNKVYC